MSETHDGIEVLTFKTQRQWHYWLKKNYDQQESVWLKFAKVSTGIPSITYEEARESAIAFGWIDGLINSLDESFFLRKLSPRRPRSSWSKINRQIAEDLIAAKQIQPSGLAQVEAAKADGRWDQAYDPPSKISPPSEIESFLKKNRKAREFYESISAANRYAFLYRIQNAKREDTKNRHIKKMIDMLTAGETYHPQASSSRSTGKRSTAKRSTAKRKAAPKKKGHGKGSGKRKG